MNPEWSPEAHVFLQQGWGGVHSLMTIDWYCPTNIDPTHMKLQWYLNLIWLARIAVGYVQQGKNRVWKVNEYAINILKQRMLLWRAVISPQTWMSQEHCVLQLCWFRKSGWLVKKWFTMLDERICSRSLFDTELNEMSLQIVKDSHL